MKEIVTTTGKFIYVDEDDYLNLHKYVWYTSNGGKSNTFYAYRNLEEGGTISIHRQIMNAVKGEIIDHIDGNGLNNCKYNLRKCSHRQNCQNSFIRKTKLSSIYKGVFFKNKSYSVEIRTEDGIIRYGRYLNEIEAAAVYNFVALKHFGEFAKLNDVDFILNFTPRPSHRSSSSEYTNIKYDKDRNAWCSLIYFNGRQHFLKRFKTEEMAYKAQQAAYKFVREEGIDRLHEFKKAL